MAEALHGGLGLVQKGDVLIAVGKSGESDELTLLAVALAVSISRDGDPTEDCIADMAVAPKFARVA